MRQNISKGLLLILCLISLVISIGVFIGLAVVRKNAPITRSFSDAKSEPDDQATLTALPAPSLSLSGVALVDFPRLLSAHPWTAKQEKDIDSRWERSDSKTNAQERRGANVTAEVERRNRNIVVRDIQRIIAAYAATNDLILVVDRSANVTSNRPVVLYPSNAVTLKEITGASGVKDITPQIMRALATGRP